MDGRSRRRAETLPGSDDDVSFACKADPMMEKEKSCFVAAKIFIPSLSHLISLNQVIDLFVGAKRRETALNFP
jgi:hypothetical protein